MLTAVNSSLQQFTMVNQELIRISLETKDNLIKLKEHHKESYEDVLVRMIKEKFNEEEDGK